MREALGCCCSSGWLVALLVPFLGSIALMGQGWKERGDLFAVRICHGTLERWGRLSFAMQHIIQPE